MRSDVMKTIYSQVVHVKKMSAKQIYDWALSIYQSGFEDGLREGEKEFEDALILTEDEARERGLNMEGL